MAFKKFVPHRTWEEMARGAGVSVPEMKDRVWAFEKQYVLRKRFAKLLIDVVARRNEPMIARYYIRKDGILILEGEQGRDIFPTDALITQLMLLNQ